MAPREEPWALCPSALLHPRRLCRAAAEGVSVPNFPPAQCQGAKVQEIGLQHEGSRTAQVPGKGLVGKTQRTLHPSAPGGRAPGGGQKRQQNQ